ncbi:MAG: glycosyltransferase family 4 protein [Chloroflexota bacterium]
MRVLHIVEATTAGVRRHVHELVCGLDRQNVQITVACSPRRDTFGDNRFVHDLSRAHIPVCLVPMSREIHLYQDGYALLRLIHIMRSGHYDIVHTHSSKAGFLGRLAARIVGTPKTIHTPNGLYFLGLSSPLKRRFYLMLEQLAAQLSDCIVAVSPSERAVLQRYKVAPANRIVCIENGITPITLPPTYNRRQQRQALGQPDDNLIVGTVARLTEQKNPFMFLEAAKHILRNLPATRFVWCGGGELIEAARRYADQLGIRHACSFLGHRDDVAAVMGAFDIFWLTSNYEGLPLVLLEAMSLSIPIIATDVVGSRDALRGIAGWLVPPGDAHALAQTTLMLIHRTDWRTSLARAGHAQFRERGMADRMIRTTEQVYQRLVSRAFLRDDQVLSVRKVL